MNTTVLNPNGSVTAQALSFTRMLLASDAFKIGSKKRYRFSIFFERINGQWYMQGTPYVVLLRGDAHTDYVKPTQPERGNVYHEAYQIAESFWNEHRQEFVKAGIVAAQNEIERLTQKERELQQELRNIRNQIENQRNELFDLRREEVVS